MKIWEVFANSLPANMTLLRVGAKICDRSYRKPQIMLTIEEIKPANIGEIKPEFGTTKDVRKYYGIKQGTLYNLHKLGKVRGKVLRVTGEFKGVRLWDMASIRALINSQNDDDDNGSGLALAA